MAAHGQASLERDRPDQPAAAAGQLVEYEAFIEQKLKKTRSHVRSVDISAGVMILLAGTLGFFLMAAVVDHWLFGGGLGFWGRLALLLAFLATATWWIATEIAPLLFKRINPLYAAQAIEQSRPTLKNTLLNFLLFRANPAGVHARVLEAIEEQAATNLAGVQVESAVDRTRLIRLGYVLVGILVLCAVYMVLSPKDLIKTVRRVAMPWADISPPTRTVIDEITPGDAQAFRGQQVKVQARVGGLPEDGKVMLYYTTADRQIVDRAVPMTRPADDHRHVAVLPAGDSALQQSLAYRIEAGDAVTREYAIEVVAAPTIVVKAIEYKYPEYTGLLSVRVEHQGDIKAIEGTEVKLEALANQDIESAYVDFDGNGTLDLRMRPEKQTAVVSFDLALREDRKAPEHGSYQVIFKNAAGQQNPQPLRHQIEVTRDLGPEIQFVSPKKDDMELPADAAVDLEVVAGDPDFALSQVQLSAAKGEAKLLDESWLREPWRGQFVKKYRFQPLKLGLKPGDVVDYWAVAADNNTPTPNRSETSRRRIRVVSPDGRQGKQDQVAQHDKRNDQQDEPQGDSPPGGNDKQPRDAQPDPDAPKTADGKQPDESSPPGEPQPAGQDKQPGKDSAKDQPPQESKDGAGDSGPGQQGDKSADGSDEAQGEQGSQKGLPNDGTNDGEAIERILKHRQQQNPPENEQPGERGQQGSQDQPTQDSSESRQKPGSSAEKKNPSQDQQRDGKQKSGEQQQPADQNGKEQAGKEQSGQDKQEGQGKEKNAGTPGDPKGQGDNGKPGEQQPGEKPQPGQEQGQNESSGSKKPTDGKESSDNADRQSSNEKGQGQAGKQAESKGSSDQKNVERKDAGGKPDEHQPDGAKPNKPDQTGQDDPRRGATQDNNTRKDGTPQKPTQGQGGQSQDDPTAKGKSKPKPDGQQSPEAKGGDGEQQKGESGAGQESKDKQGSPQAQEPAKPRNKSQQPGSDKNEDAKNEDSPQSPSNSKKESDSQGGAEGDQSGGGKKGGGQKANKPGTGGAGQNTSADEGAGKSDEAGDGETSDRAGADREAAGKTGQSGTKQGDGSKSQSSTGENEKPGGDDAPQDSSDSKSSSGDQKNPGPGGAGPGEPGASRPDARGSQEKPWKPGVDQADKANLEYARKATDLALEHLRDQLKKGQPDPELLDRLGWSKQDLEKFVKRWEAMRGNTAAPGDQGQTARRELDETLRSLGLRPRATALKSNAARDDRSQGYQESHRTTPPPEFSEAFKAYTQGTARGGK